MFRYARIWLGLLALATAGSSLSARQDSADLSKILALARSGRSVDAWAAWTAKPKTPETLRFGVTLARETKQINRGLQIYSDLAETTHAVDRPALTELALAASDGLATSPDDEARLLACSAAVALQPTHEACGQTMKAFAANAQSDEWAVALYARANTGHRPPVSDMNVAERRLTMPTRLHVAASMTHLPAAERVSLVRPVLTDPSVPRRYQALLILASIPGAEARDALLSELGGSPAEPMKTAILIGLARHGHAASLTQVKALLPTLGEYEQAQAARALAQAGDPSGRARLQQALRDSGDIAQLDAAEAIAEFDRAAASHAVLQSLAAGSPTIRQRALELAGDLELGSDKAAYIFLADPSPLVRAAAVAAIQETFFLQDANKKARHP